MPDSSTLRVRTLCVLDASFSMASFSRFAWSDEDSTELMREHELKNKQIDRHTHTASCTREARGMMLLIFVNRALRTCTASKRRSEAVRLSTRAGPTPFPPPPPLSSARPSSTTSACSNASVSLLIVFVFVLVFFAFFFLPTPAPPLSFSGPPNAIATEPERLSRGGEAGRRRCAVCQRNSALEPACLGASRPKT